LLTFARRLKLSNDPNNTTWTKDTTGFGHKIMKSQGWQPGDYLGAKDAPHAEFHTEANASHIRVVLKDDNLGIGAKKGSGQEQGECVGLDVFQSLLGRLNGRDENELAQEQKSREDLKRAIYTERKWGSIRFLSGGFLIGDKIQDLINGEAERIRQLAVDSSSDSEASSDSSSTSESEATPDLVPIKEKKSKKSKRTTEVEISEAVVEPENGKTKSKKKRKLAETEADGVAIVAKVKKSKKSRKSEPEEDAAKSKDAKSKSKKDKEKNSKKKSTEDSLDPSSTSVSKPSKTKSKRSGSEATISDSSETTPAPIEVASRPILLGGRHAVRSRNIAQKRLAAMDSASLNEVRKYWLLSLLCLLLTGLDFYDKGLKAELPSFE
jgi:Pin2-interacting protein X1